MRLVVNNTGMQQVKWLLAAVMVGSFLYCGNPDLHDALIEVTLRNKELHYCTMARDTANKRLSEVLVERERASRSDVFEALEGSSNVRD